MPEPDTATREVQQLRRCIRDLVALSAFPAVWVGYDPRQIAESLADGLRHMLNLDLIYLAVRDRADGIGVEVARTLEGPAPADRVQEIRRVLETWLKADPPGLPPSIPDPLGNGAVPIVLNPFGSGESGGILVAGSRRADFPTEVDRLLLGVGANQAALLLERRRAEEALRASEQRFRTFVDHATDAFFLHDDRLVVVDVNRQACLSLGYTRDELVGRTPLDFDPDVTPDLLAEFGRKLDTGEMLAFESRHRRKDGSVFPVEVRGRPFREGGRRLTVALARDITERKRLEAELRQAKDRLDLAIRGSNVGLWEVDMPDGDYAKGVTSWINVWEQLGLEPPADRSPSLVSVDFVHPDDKVRVLRALNAYLDGETKEYEIEYRVRHKEGTYRWMLSRGTAIRDPAGKAIRLLGSRVDITELKRVEEVLRESEAWFRFLANAMPQIVWTARPDGSAQWVNQRCEEYTGIPPAEILGEGWLAAIHPDDRDGVMTRWLADVVEGVGHDMEYRIRGADGRYRWFKSRGLPVRDESGRVVQWLGTITDIDDQKRAEEALREGERRFRTLAEALPHMVWTAEPDGAHDYFNARTTEYTGLTREQLRGWHWRSTIHPEDLPRCLELWSRSIATGEPYEIEYRLRRADGAFRWHLARALALRDDSGRITKWFGSCIDIDDQNRAQQALREAKEVAEAANRAKDEFLANVSHEIRTPMNAILGMTELALETPGSDAQRQYLTIVKSSADALLNVINDLLDFSKIEAGKLELDHAGFSLRSILGETLRALALRAHKKGLELVCQIQPDVPDALIGDAGRLRQILLNLVGNAIKFTEEGEVVVRIEVGPTGAGTEPDSLEDRSGPSQMLGFSVSDTGIGIPLDKQQKIFQAFEQEDNSTTRRYGGTGLGLSIAKCLVALMRGAIGVESEPGRGSTFHFTARFGLQADQPVQPIVPPLVELQGLRVLVVDDNATNRRILEGWLRGWRTEPTVVAGGLEALDALWRASASGRPFPLVVLDARMPGIDGLALAERILRSPELSPTRIILLTSDGLHGEVARFRELGIAAYAMKPVQQEELLKIIYQVLSRPAPIAAATDDTSPPSGEEEAPITPAEAAESTARLRILLAEDNDFNQQLIDHLLRRQGHDVVVAHDGRRALEALDHGSFDLMLLDIQMPEFDGFQVIQALRRRERAEGGHLPVVALTAHSMKGDRERCLQAGMDEYLSKPIRAAELFAVIERVLAGLPASAAPVPSAAAPGGVLDATTLLAACDDDPVLLGKLIRIFQNNLPGSLARVQEAIMRQDPAQLQEAAHQSRGLLSTFSSEAAQAAARLEAMGAGGELGDAAAAFEDLADIIGRLRPILENLPIDELRRRSRRPLE
jgi:two-component system, sensor histidine kinase and response regulator